MTMSHLPGHVLKPTPGYAQLQAIKILHHDQFAAKVPGSPRCLRRVTQPPFIAGLLALTRNNYSN
jgi:hypothetical protein